MLEVLAESVLCSFINPHDCHDLLCSMQIMPFISLLACYFPLFALS